jgi:hypothetical protein
MEFESVDEHIREIARRNLELLDSNPSAALMEIEALEAVGFEVNREGDETENDDPSDDPSDDPPPFIDDETDDECVQRENTFADNIDRIIDNSTPESSSPYILKSQLSAHFYDMARKAITEFFKDKTMRYNVMGYSSGNMCMHGIFRSKDNIIFEVHCAYGTTRCYYMTKDGMSVYYEHYENEMPDFEDPEVLNTISNPFLDC